MSIAARSSARTVLRRPLRTVPPTRGTRARPGPARRRPGALGAAVAARLSARPVGLWTAATARSAICACRSVSVTSSTWCCRPPHGGGEGGVGGVGVDVRTPQVATPETTMVSLIPASVPEPGRHGPGRCAGSPTTSYRRIVEPARGVRRALGTRQPVCNGARRYLDQPGGRRRLAAEHLGQCIEAEGQGASTGVHNAGGGELRQQRGGAYGRRPRPPARGAR